ncbi:LysE family translocator [Magnetospirillum sp. UT-4]|uniref:LysE family translocator n=1 Tax=Magnetospirillum sp. UT-4 TaxID=2681467 RepID=UPI0013831481|nr:LysE family transporter [Magnetospirillum sp. UT-4]CAA7623819.1 Lysine exporter protein (LYSE/YGGA) [Magnetospirillum sp. UT-4]
MDGLITLRGVAIGFAIAAPIGPVGLMCIRKALADGRLAAWMAGLGAALADTVFGAVVALGLGVVSQFVDGHGLWLKLGGGAFMLALGVHTWRAAAFAMEPASGHGPGLARDFAATFLITISNPGTMLGVTGVFAAMGAAAQPVGMSETWQLVAGVFAGSALWWAVLTEITILARARFTPERMRLFNHVSGGLLMLLGVAAVVSGIWGE